jgi:hypothetical protein
MNYKTFVDVNGRWRNFIIENCDCPLHEKIESALIYQKL